MHHNKFEPVRNISRIFQEIDDYGIKCILLDATMKNLPPVQQIKCFRLFKAKIRKAYVQDPNERIFYDLHFHYVPRHKALGNQPYIEPVIKIGAKTISFTEAGIDEFELNSLMHSFFYAMANFNPKILYSKIRACKVHHKGNYQGDHNPYVYELPESYESDLKEIFINYINKSKNNNFAMDLYNTGEAFKIRSQIIANKNIANNEPQGSQDENAAN